MVSIINITENLEKLYALAPFSEELKAFKRQIDLLDFTYSDLRHYGSALTRDGVESILTGNMVSGIPVFEHRLCEAHRRLLARFESRFDMDADIDAIKLNEFFSVLSGLKQCAYRREALPLYHLDFVPDDEQLIPENLKRLFSRIRRKDKEGGYIVDGIDDFCRRAAAIHMGIIKIYPYSDGFSELAARVSMQYELVRAGYFPVDIGLSEQEYNKLTAGVIKTGDAEAFAESLRSAVLKKLELLTAAARRGH